ncbi:alpha/beta hydrolase [Actinocorallia lasiicapitis]
MPRLLPLAGAAALFLGLLSPVAADAAVPARLPAQKIAWEKCFTPPQDTPPEEMGDDARLECAVYEAPLDWSRPDGQQIKLFVTRMPARNGKPKGAVFTNPGGPGAYGAAMPLMFAYTKGSRLAEEMDVYGLDVRGTDMLTCGDNFHGGELDPRDRRAKNVKKLLKAARDTAKACQKLREQRYVTTAQTVRDLDLLRSLIGQHKIHWIGYSGGSWLGAHYAAQFPAHTGRFVLDSNVEFTGRWQDAFNLQPRGFERRFRKDFAGWAARHHRTLKLGRTAKKVIATYEGIRKDIVREPLPFMGSELRPSDVDYMIAGAMYTKEAFPQVAALLATLRRYTGLKPNGRAAAASTLDEAITRLRSLNTPLLAATDDEDGEEGEEPPRDSQDATFYAITCNDTPHRGTPQRLAADSAKLGRAYPLIGWSTINDPCQYWKRPATGPKLKRPGRNLATVLMVQSAHDPATPYEGALKAHRALKNSRMLTVTGEGDHGVYLSGNKCVDRTVDAYLIDGKAPKKKDVSCKGTPLPKKAYGPGGEPFFGFGLRSGNPIQRLGLFIEKFTFTK